MATRGTCYAASRKAMSSLWFPSARVKLGNLLCSNEKIRQLSGFLDRISGRRCVSSGGENESLGLEGQHICSGVRKRCTARCSNGERTGDDREEVIQGDVCVSKLKLNSFSRERHRVRIKCLAACFVILINSPEIEAHILVNFYMLRTLSPSHATLDLVQTIVCFPSDRY